jgi:hypothetical protein
MINVTVMKIGGKDGSGERYTRAPVSMNGRVARWAGGRLAAVIDFDFNF